MRRGLFVVACVSVLACRAPRPEAPAPEADTDTGLDDDGWSAALAAVKPTWAALPDSATTLTFVLDDHVRDDTTLSLLRGRVEIDGTPLTLEGEPRLAGAVVAPGRHTLSFEVGVGGPPCVYCSMYLLRVSRKNVPIDLDARTSSVMRIGVRADGPVTKPIEERLRMVVEVRAWRRVNDGDVGALARDAADHCIDETSRHVAKDRVYKDVIKLVCHRDELERCRVIRASIDDHEKLWLDARARSDANAASHELAIVAALGQKAADVTREIPYCGD